MVDGRRSANAGEAEPPVGARAADSLFRYATPVSAAPKLLAATTSARFRFLEVLTFLMSSNYFLVLY